MADDYTSDSKLPSQKDPTPVGTGTNLPYIGKCVDWYSWLNCAKMAMNLSTLYPGDGALYSLMIGGTGPYPFLIDNFGQLIVNTTPNAGNSTLLGNQYWVFLDDMWSNPGNNFGYLDQANSCCPPFYGLPYHNGCTSFDLKINQWKNLQSNIQGHIASPPPSTATPPGSNTLAQSMTSFTSALSGTSQHYSWWRMFYKIRWAEDMKKCCNCGEWYNPTHG